MSAGQDDEKAASGGATGSGGDSGSRSPKAHQLTIGTATIIAAVWAGLWGFNWAATHLSSGQLFVAILAGLSAGTALTAYLGGMAIKAVRDVAKMQGGDAHGFRLT